MLPSHPLFRPLLVACTALLALACSESPSSPPATADAATADSADAATQLDTAADVAALDVDEPDLCPGGTGCTCAANADCDNSLCIDTPDGRQCARNCVDDCPSGFKCAVAGTGGDVVTVCVPTWGRVCDPCATAADCAATGLTGSACVDHGAAGRFCGVACQADTDCPPAFTCQTLTSTEGAQVKQCAPAPAAGQTAPGACPCSPAARKAALATSCTLAKVDGAGQVVGTCAGSRACGATGLGTCSVVAPPAETCNGVDDDCDGTVDGPAAPACPDGQSCTAGQCQAACTPVDGGWSEFQWGECSQTCGGGERQGTRTCTDPAPSCGGKACEGQATLVELCNTQPCCSPVDGGWTDWQWGECSKTCGGGERQGTRTCTQPAPACGGKGCDGPDATTEPCNTQPCGIGKLPTGTTAFTEGGQVVAGAVPAGKTSLAVQLWGAGGGGGAPGPGGGGGWLSATLPVQPGDLVELRVGSGGAAPGGGGGASYVLKNGEVVLVAAGGGGGGSDGCSGCHKGVSAGGAGGAVGGNGQAGSADATYGTNSGGGGGGTQTAGGAAGVSNNQSPYKTCAISGQPGQAHQGGAAVQAVNDACTQSSATAAAWHLGSTDGKGNGAGGGGGSGRFGGGSGASMWTYSGGGGGGGASWSAPQATVLTTQAGNGQDPGGATAPGYTGEAGRGGAPQTEAFGPKAGPGRAGLVILTL